MTPELFHQLEERGYKGRVVPIQHLRDMREGIEGLYGQGLLDEEFHQERLAVFSFHPPENLPDARSLIVIAVPEPCMRITFTRDGEPLSLIVPPTFFPAQEINERVADSLARILGPAGYRVAQAVLPKKLLAVHSGLGTYGRNNLCYIPEMGSFHRLVALCSDLPCQEDTWQELRMMESCQKCSACLRNCPTGAITSERFLLRAERCITFHNERSNDITFPAWLDPSWHNSLIGCTHCQRVCPQNQDFLDWVEDGAAFSQEETDLLLERVPLDQLPATTAEKLKQFDMVDLLDVLPRNLLALTKE